MFLLEPKQGKHKRKILQSFAARPRPCEVAS